jgi:DNA repair protein RadC
MVYLKQTNIAITSARDVVKVFQDLLFLEDQIDREKEHFYVCHLNAKSRIKLVELISIGTLSNALVHPRETFRRAVCQGSASIIVAHNHPSGEAEPSEEDTRVTKLLFDAGNILGIKLLDHVIFTPTQFFSFRDNRVHMLSSEKTSQKGGERI